MTGSQHTGGAAEESRRITDSYLARVLEITDDAVILIDAAHHIRYFNHGAEKIFGYSAADVLGQSLERLLPAFAKDAHSRHIQTFADAPAKVHRMSERKDIFGRRADGSEFPAEASICKIDTPEGLLFAAILHDVSARRQAQLQMQQLSNAVEHAAEAVVICNRDGIIGYVNPAFTEMTGYTPEEVIGQTPRLLKSGQHAPEFYASLWDVLLSGEIFHDVFINRKKDGGLYYEEKTITPLKDPSGAITHFVSTSKDISGRIEAEGRLYRLAYHDALTGLPNRALFLERLEHALRRRPGAEGMVAVLLVDLDRFKTINDTLGHEIGDRVLKELPARLLSSVGDTDVVARLGGDEFALLVEDVDTQEDLIAIAKKILDAVAQPFKIDEHELFVTASIGISLYPDSAKDISALMQYADAAMYRAKDLGRNTWLVYADAMSAKAKERLSLENRLRRALERDEFILHYQFQVSLKSGRITGAEALIRWQHSELGLVSPLEFIPLLEETGLIVAVGDWVLATACAQNRAWQDAGLPALCVAVNLSPRQLMQKSLLRKVEQVLAMAKLESNRLDIEITEGTVIRDAENAIHTLNDLREMGVKLSLDDFGTGYSSLNYLKRLPVDTVKIDRSFVKDVTADSDSAAIVRSIIAMSHSMKKEVVAEGVETVEQLAYLTAQECDGMQGYFFSKPLPADQIARMLREGHGLNVDKIS